MSGGAVFPFQDSVQLLLLLAMGHFLVDFGLQSDRMAREKCPAPGQSLGWGWWLTAHAAGHGFLVGWITGVPWLGLAEWLAHALLDWAKCRHFWKLGVDQALHLGCKALWVVLAVGLTGR